MNRGVDFVMIDAWASRLHGSPLVTNDLDICHSREPENLDGIDVLVASLDDLISMKLAAGRPKDLYQAEVLGAVREEIDTMR